jgi:hypothetical protein
VKCRSQNQNTSLILYKLMTENISRLKKDSHLSNSAIPLVAISFNLWRAVFLTDEDKNADGLEHSVAFLKTLISDNQIAYAQDKNARAWTCGSYLNNARFRLEGISKTSPEILPNFTFKRGTRKEVWEQLQANTDLAVGNFGNALKRPPQSN